MSQGVKRGVSGLKEVSQGICCSALEGEFVDGSDAS